VPVSPRFFAELGEYLVGERPPDAVTEQLFVVLKGQRRGQPLSAAGLDQIVQGARQRAGLPRLTCHQLRHTCLTRLREAGMALEALQAQAGHRSLEATRIYLHLSNEWLAKEYRDAMARSRRSNSTWPPERRSGAAARSAGTPPRTCPSARSIGG
jgi:integrase